MLKRLLATIKFIINHPLNQAHKGEALKRYLRWQIGTRILGKQVLIPWVDDAKFITGVGETGLTGNIYTGFMEYEDMVFVLHTLQTGEIFVDVGANIGAYTILASKVVGAHSIAFEPLPETVERFKDQININRLNDLVEVKNNGVGDKDGALYFTNNKDTVNKVSLGGEASNTTKVDVITLDSVLDKNKSHFFKIDVEGFEYKVIEGAKDILSSPNTTAVILELNGCGAEFGHSDDEVHKKLTSLNFIPVRYEPISRTLTKLDGYNKDGGNTIYIKDFEVIAAKCKSAPKLCIHTAGGLQI